MLGNYQIVLRDHSLYGGHHLVNPAGRSAGDPRGDGMPVSTANTQPSSAEWGALLLRLSLGIMFLAHSVVLKLMTYGPTGTAQFFVSVGLPAWLAYVTVGWEIVGGVLLLLGLWTRVVALAMAPILLGALLVVHGGNGWVFTSPNGGWEYPVYLFVLCLAQALLGAGPYALKLAVPQADLAIRTAQVGQ
jgi:putative oxidoreductase